MTESRTTKCPWCNGSGKEVVEHASFGPQVTECPDCEGTGEVLADNANDN